MELYSVLIRGTLWEQNRLYELCYIYVWDTADEQR